MSVKQSDVTEYAEERRTKYTYRENIVRESAAVTATADLEKQGGVSRTLRQTLRLRE